MMNINKYPDGTSYVTIDDIEGFKYIFRINSYEDLWHLNQLVDAENNQSITPLITIPNLLDGQADRRFEYNQSSGLKLVCKLLNDMDADFEIFHPHNSEVVEALMPNASILDNSNFIKQVIYNELCPGPGFPDVAQMKNLILMSSDAGGFKPLMKFCDQIKWEGETFSASKARSWDEETGTKFIQSIDREDFGGKDILIVDDISVYGGTFKGLSKLLRERNVGKLYLAVSHMTVQNLGDDPVTNYFDKVFTTNSKFDSYYGQFENGFDTPTQEPENLKIINLF